MTNKKVTRRALLMSVTSLLICISMLLGTTFAWFTDEVTSGVNQIVAGNLDVELEHKSVTDTNYSAVTTDTKLFKNAVGEQLLWEPGAMAYESFKVSNVGTLALKYKFNLNTYDYNTVTRGTDKYDLRDVLKVLVVDGDTIDRATLEASTEWKSWSVFTSGDSFVGELNPGTEGTATKTIAIWWQPNDNAVDNLYNLKNQTADGWTLDKQNEGKDELYIGVGVTLVAGQKEYEKDSFDEHYDATAEYPTITSATATTQVVAGTATKLTAAIAPADSSTTTVEFAADALDDNATAVLTVDTKDIIAANEETTTTFQVSDGNTAVASIDLSLTVGGVEKTGEFGAAKITTYIAKNLEDVVLAYHGTGDTQSYTSKASEAAVTGAGDYYYEAATGKLVFITTHFSEYYVSASNEAVNTTKGVAYRKLVNANTDNIGAINDASAGDTIVLLKDVTLGRISNDNNGNVSVSITKNLTLDGNDHTLYSTAGRGIWVDESDVTFNLKNLTIMAAENNAGFERAVQVNGGKTNVTLTIDNCEMKSTYYAINFCNGTSVNVTINNSTVTGWGALNIWSSGVKVTATNSTFNGINDKSYNAEGWNNFATIVLEGDTTQASGMGASNMQVTLTNCTITASQTTGNNQALVGFNNNSGSGANNNGVILENCTLTYGDGCILSYDYGTDNVLSGANCTINGVANQSIITVTGEPAQGDDPLAD